MILDSPKTSKGSLRYLLAGRLRDRNDETLERIYTGRRFKNNIDRIALIASNFFGLHSPSTKPPLDLSMTSPFSDLYRLIDWVLTLPPELEEAFRQDLETYERGKNMPYISAIERIGEARGGGNFDRNG